jgi:hypothetical protein
MNQHQQDTAWIKQFRETVILRQRSDFLGMDEISDAAMKKYNDMIEARDILGPSGRDILIPLLQDTEDSVRVVAAANLLEQREDIALPVLLDVEENCVTEAYYRSSRVLNIYRVRKRAAGQAVD